MYQVSKWFISNQWFISSSCSRKSVSGIGTLQQVPLQVYYYYFYWHNVLVVLVRVFALLLLLPKQHQHSLLSHRCKKESTTTGSVLLAFVMVTLYILLFFRHFFAARSREAENNQEPEEAKEGMMSRLKKTFVEVKKAGFVTMGKINVSFLVSDSPSHIQSVLRCIKFPESTFTREHFL